ncbi:MAG: oligosaccharide flippase family protein [Myxococcota bacterium]
MGKAAAKGTVWVFGAFGVQQVARLGGNVLLTRLLFPEAFGIMRVLNVVVAIVGMLSDAGLRGSIIFHKRGDDPDFYNTAWTLQCLRGVVVAAVVAALAVPLASFYALPELAILLPVVGASMIFRGAQSTAVFTLSRRVQPKPFALLDVSIRIAALVITVVLAVFWKSVWVLALGMVLTNVGHGFFTHFLIKGYRNRWRWDKDAVRDQISFGKWVFISSALAALLGQGGSMVVAKLLSETLLGVYSMALMLSEAPVQALNAVARSVLQPLYAKFVNGDKAQFRGRLFRVRAALLALFLPVLWVPGVFGQEIVDLLFDERYAQAGWMLRVLMPGVIGTSIIATVELLFVASGESRTHLVHKAWGAGLFVVGLAVGWHYGEFPGLLIGYSAGRVAGYLPMAVLLARRGAWLPKLDGLAFLSSALVLGLGFYFHPLVIP